MARDDLEKSPKQDKTDVVLPVVEDISPLSILGPEPDREFHDLAELAAAVCSTPIALVTFLDARFLHIKGAAGQRAETLERGGTFCDYTVQQDGLFVVPDVSHDPRFAGSLYLTQVPPILFYAGFPLHSPQGSKMGVLCVLDNVRRELKDWQVNALSKLARQVNSLIELRIRRKVFERTLSTIEGEADLFTVFADGIPYLCYLKDSAHRLLYYNVKLGERFGVAKGEWLGKTSHQLWPKEQADAIRRAEEQVFRSGRPGELLIQLPGTDGASTSCRLYQIPYRSALGESLLAVMAVHSDGETAAV